MESRVGNTRLSEADRMGEFESIFGNREKFSKEEIIKAFNEVGCDLSHDRIYLQDNWYYTVELCLFPDNDAEVQELVYVFKNRYDLCDFLNLDKVNNKRRLEIFEEMEMPFGIVVLFKKPDSDEA